MQIHADAVTSTGIGLTADSFETIGTVRTREDAVQLLGAFVAAGPVTTTAAEAYTGQYRFTNNTLSLRTIRQGPPSEGGAASTNVGHRVLNPYWIPMRRGSESNPIGQLDILCEFAHHVPSSTDNSAVAASIIYTARGAAAGGAPFPEPIKRAYETIPNYVPGSLVQNWDSEAGADLATVAESAITDLEVESAASGIVGLGGSWAPDVFGAEEFIGFLRFRSSIPNFEPQEWLLPGCGAPLGTAVGVGSFNVFGGVQYPTFFPKRPGTIATITPNVVWVAAVTTSNPTVSADVAWMI